MGVKQRAIKFRHFKIAVCKAVFDELSFIVFVADGWNGERIKFCHGNDIIQRYAGREQVQTGFILFTENMGGSRCF